MLALLRFVEARRTGSISICSEVVVGVDCSKAATDSMKLAVMGIIARRKLAGTQGPLLRCSAWKRRSLMVGFTRRSLNADKRFARVVFIIFSHFSQDTADFLNPITVSASGRIGGELKQGSNLVESHSLPKL